ncbi:MAG TPA: PqiC family protein [Candidatus Binataceae bacterium]|nr:PqiC family protein [Candidatus Binataceae bacterium]
MMLRRIVHLIAAFACATVIAACGTSAPPRFYTLDASATASGLPATGGNVTVGPVTIPASVDQPQFVTQNGPNRVDVDEFNRWASPLNDNIARVVAENLVALLGTPNVAVGPLANFIPDYAVAIDVQRFESVRGQRTELDAVWTIHDKARGTTQSGRTSANETVADDSFDALAAAHSRALSMLSDDIAKAIRADANRARVQSDP